MGGDPGPFSTSPLHNLLKGITRLSQHIPKQAPPVSVAFIRAACDVLQVLSPDAQTVRAALLMGYASFLHQSNLLLCPGPAASHHLRRADVEDAGPTIWLHIRSSKTIYDPRHRVAIPVPTTHSPYCPVAAWREYAARIPLPPASPAFMLNASTPLTQARLLAILRPVLTALGHPSPNSITVHSLRRSGAQECARRGALPEHIMHHGTWTSSAVNAYVPKKLYTSVPAIMKEVLAARAPKST